MDEQAGIRLVCACLTGHQNDVIVRQALAASGGFENRLRGKAIGSILFYDRSLVP